MFWNQYPYLNLNDLNLDFLLKAIGEMKYQVENFVSINAIKYANPIQWDITRQYEKNTIVIDPVTGTAYISVAPVPEGVALTRDEYWTVVFDLGSFVTRAAQNFTNHWESDTTTTATFSTPAGGWLVWGDVLYKALVNITAGDSYVIDSNIRHFTIEDIYNEYLNTINTIVGNIGDLVDLNTADKSSIVNAINEVNTNLNNEINTRINDIDSVNSKIGILTDLNTSDKSNVVNAINEVNTLAGANAENIGDLSDLSTVDKDSVVNAINEISNIINASKYTVADYGIFPDGTDVSDAIQDLLDQNIPLIFNAGTYVLSKRLTASGSVFISGCGIGNTILKFVDNGGFEVVATHIFDNYYSSTFNIANLTIVSSVANETIAAIRFDNEVGVTDRVTMNPNLMNIDIHGIDGGYFKECVVLYSCNGATVYGCSFTGNIPSKIANSFALRIDGDTNYPIGTEFMLTSNKYAHFDKCIVGDYCEGLIITSSIFLASDYGVFWVSTTGPHPHLAVTSTHMNSFVTDIYVDNICQLNICNNLLYLQSTDDNGKFIQILSNSYRSIENLITNNNFIQITNHIMDGIMLNADYTVISNNLFSIAYPASFAVRVMAGSTNTEISNNILRDTANGMYNAGTETRSDWQIDGTVDYTGSSMTKQGLNPVLYDENGLTAYVAFATESATVSVNDLLATVSIPAELQPIANIPTLSNTNRLFTFKLLSNGQLRSNDAIPANTHIVCCITAKYKAM